jgi:tetratricopeptide (TPR) repeat protein
MKGGIEDYNQALRINPNYAEAYYNRGVTRAQLKGGIEDFNEALEDFNEALRINPNYAEAYYNRAAIRYQLVGKIQKITGHIRPPICKRNDYSCLFYLIGSLFTKDNTSERKKAIANLAIADLQKAFELFLQQGKMAEYQKTLDLLKKINENKH